MTLTSHKLHHHTLILAYLLDNGENFDNLRLTFDALDTYNTVVHTIFTPYKAIHPIYTRFDVSKSDF